MNFFKHSAIPWGSWLPVAIVATAMSLLVYVAVQQNYRHSADDPQIQIAEDVAIALTAGQPPESITSENPTDIAKSLAPYVLVFDADGKPLSGTAQLDGEIPTVPKGALDFARAHGQNRISWQPRAGVRSAIVIAPYEGEKPGTIVAGKSLREVDIRISQLGFMVFISWLATIIVTFGIFAVFSRKKRLV